MLKHTFSVVFASFLYVACCGMPHLPWTLSSSQDFQTELSDGGVSTQAFTVTLSEGAVVEAQAHGGHVAVRVNVQIDGATGEAVAVSLDSRDLDTAIAEGDCAAGARCDLWLYSEAGLTERCATDGDCDADFEISFSTASGSAVRVDWTVYSDLTVFDPDEEHTHSGSPEGASIEVVSLTP